MHSSAVVRFSRARDFWAGLFFAGVALSLWIGLPGGVFQKTSLPSLVALALWGITAIVWLRLLIWPTRRKKVQWHIPLWVCVVPCGWAFWAATVEVLGLFCSTLGMVVLVMLTHPQRQWSKTIVSALIISVLMTLFFVVGLELTVPVYPTLFMR